MCETNLKQPAIPYMYVNYFTIKQIIVDWFFWRRIEMDISLDDRKSKSSRPSVSLVRDRFATPRVNRKEGDEEERGVERSGRRAENKKRAKWSAGPVVSCDRKWHSFFASLPSSSTKPRGACTRSPSSISSPLLLIPRRALLLIPSSTLERTQQQRKIALS